MSWNARLILHLLIVILVLAAFALTGVTHAALQSRERAGLALWYSPGVMGRVAYNRGLPLRLCMIASPHHAIGARVLVTGRRTGRSRLCVVYDVPQTRHRPGLIRRGVVAELDFRSAKILCGERGGQPRNCRVTVRDV
jgi:hypothetical protein